MPSSIFYSLFQSNEKGHGRFLPGSMDGDKQSGRYQMDHSPGTISLWKEHLEGSEGLGLSPLLSDSTCVWSALDIDIYEEKQINALAQFVHNMHLPLVPCRSKSKGLHLYAFFGGREKASSVRRLMSKYANLLLQPKAEIFPKQDVCPPGNGFPSWINMPYFNASGPTAAQKYIKPDLSPGSVNEFLQAAFAATMSLQDREKNFSDGFIFAGAPPCITAPLTLGTGLCGGRNNYLFSVCTYLTARYGEVSSDKVLEINDMLDDPLPQEEVLTTVIAGFQKKSYAYRCSGDGYCDKAVCLTSKYGPRSGTAPAFDFGRVIVMNEDPPYYIWEINGRGILFKDEEEVLNQKKVRQLCLRELGQIPDMMDAETWTAVVNKSFAQREIVASFRGGFSEASRFENLLASYLYDHDCGNDLALLHAGGGIVYLEDKREFHFAPLHLMNFLKTNDMKMHGLDVQRKLIRMGATCEGGHWLIKADEAQNTLPADRPHFIQVDYHDRESRDEKELGI